MRYLVRFRSRARSELDDCCATYGGNFCGEIHAWLDQLADEAEAKDGALSIDAFELFGDAVENVTRPWGHSLKRFREASTKQRLLALYHVLRKKCPPWEFRATVRPFTFLGACTCEIHVVYEVDHVTKRIIICKFIDLPGQA